MLNTSVCTLYDDSIMQMTLGERLWEGEGKEGVTYFIFFFEKKSDSNHHVP